VHRRGHRNQPGRHRPFEYVDGCHPARHREHNSVGKNDSTTSMSRCWSHDDRLASFARKRLCVMPVLVIIASTISAWKRSHARHDALCSVPLTVGA
jgi:hypothetical protein